VELERIREFERRTGIPISSTHSAVVIRWTMLLTILALVIILITLIFVHLYLRLQADSYPPEGIAIPDATLPGMAVIMLILGSAFAYLANTGVTCNNRTRSRNGLLVAGFTCAVALVFVIAHAALQLEFTPQTNAYGSSFYMLGIYQVMLLIAGIPLCWLSAYWVARSPKPAQRLEYVHDIARYVYTCTAFAVVMLGLLYLLPYVL
jgi:heme/copper-type cytochrome/quinol oxidase subunit 3